MVSATRKPVKHLNLSSPEAAALLCLDGIAQQHTPGVVAHSAVLDVDHIRPELGGKGPSLLAGGHLYLGPLEEHGANWGDDGRGAAAEKFQQLRGGRRVRGRVSDNNNINRDRDRGRGNI